MRATPLDDGRDHETHLGVIDPEAAPPDVALLPVGEDAAFLQRWQALQARFTEDPRRSVEHADALVAEVMERLAEGFADARDRLEEGWSRDEELAADDLEDVLRRYRAFFERLLTA
jgi:L-ascorbate metabolism protein UlaG (beta-lactamase superfamily)